MTERCEINLERVVMTNYVGVSRELLPVKAAVSRLPEWFWPLD